MATTWRLEHEEVVDEVEALGLLIRETESGLIAFGVIRGVAEREAAVRALKERLGLPFKEFTLSSDQKDPVALLLSVPGDERACVSFYDLESALPDAAGFLNLQRERFGEAPHAVLFWVVEDGLRRLATLAPDFWAWRSGVFDFRSGQYERPIAGVLAAFSEGFDFQDRGDLERRISLYQGLLDEYARQTEPDVQFLGRLHIRLARSFMGLDRLAKAEAHADRALDHGRQAGDRNLEADALTMIGSVAIDTGRLDEAEASFRKALALYQEGVDNAGVATSFFLLGHVAFWDKRLDEAEGLYRKALELQRRLGLVPAVAGTYHQLGNVALQRERLDDSEEWYQEALHAFERLGLERDAAREYHHLGMVAEDRRRLGEAEELYREALTVLERLGNERHVAIEYHVLGVLAQRRERLEESDEWYRKALVVRERLGHALDLAVTLAQIGLLRRTQGRQCEAVSWFSRALSFASEHEKKEGAGFLADIARMAAALGDQDFSAAWREAFDGKDPPPEVMRQAGAVAQASSASDSEQPHMTLDGYSAAEPVGRLVEEFHKLPGIGPKTAQRLTYYMVRMPEEEARSLAEAVLAVKERIVLCSACFNITESDPCRLCTEPQRDQSLICVVEEALDVVSLERSGVYRGLYHVLHGVISPMNGIGPDDLKIQPLLSRLKSGEVQEVVLATNPNLEGEATSMYIHRLISPLGVKVTRLARGLPVGGDVEYADEVTLGRAIEGRQEF